ncbi:hypothetical protein YC2023_094567 [Brassica napus]
MAVSYLVAAKTNMEVLLEVVEAEAKLVVAKKTKVNMLMSVGAAGTKSFVADNCAVIFFRKSVATGGGWRNNRGCLMKCGDSRAPDRDRA